MKATTYCFLPGVKFDPIPRPFKVKDGVAWIGNDYEPNTGQKKQEIVGCFLSYETGANIEEFLRKSEAPKPGTKEYDEEFKKIGELLDKYRGELNEVATLIEGLISVMTIKPFPAFLIGHVNVRLNPENEEDSRLIKEEKVHHTFGDVGRSRDSSLITVGGIDSILEYAPKAEERLSALSIYTLASRAEERLELEIAYANFFRIIEGYFGDGTKNIENSLQDNAGGIVKLLRPNEDFLNGLQAILAHLKLPSHAKSLSAEKEIISDLVLLRHKLMHYNLTHHNRHFYSTMRIDLKKIITNLHRAAFFLLRNDIEGKS